jgi:DNA-binding NarL/FixJ family response regulator
VVADDHPAIVDSVSYVLADDGGFDIVAHASDGVEALELIREHGPDVALVDIGMPGLDGIELTRRLAADGAGTKIVLYSGSGDPERAAAAFEAGASGYVLKGAPLAVLARALRSVASGERFVDPDLPERPAHTLTPREREVLRLTAEGLRNDEVAERLSISPLTVRTHMKNAMEKLDAATRTEAVATALRRSLIP